MSAVMSVQRALLVMATPGVLLIGPCTLVMSAPLVPTEAAQQVHGHSSRSPGHGKSTRLHITTTVHVPRPSGGARIKPNARILLSEPLGLVRSQQRPRRRRLSAHEELAAAAPDVVRHVEGVPGLAHPACGQSPPAPTSALDHDAVCVPVPLVLHALGPDLHRLMLFAHNFLPRVRGPTPETVALWGGVPHRA